MAILAVTWNRRRWLPALAAGSDFALLNGLDVTQFDPLAVVSKDVLAEAEELLATTTA